MTLYTLVYNFLFSLKMFSAVHFSCSVVPDSLQPYGLQHARPPCLSPIPGVYSNSCVLVSDAIQPSHPRSPPSPPAFKFSQHQGLFQWVSSLNQVDKVLKCQLQQNIPMNIQDWSPLGWTGWISLQSKGLSSVFSNTTVQKRQFFNAQLSLWSNSHIYTWPLGKPQPWLDGLCQQSNVSAF